LGFYDWAGDSMTGRCSFTVLFSGFRYLLCDPVRFGPRGGAIGRMRPIYA
jgi:hypothetical protein